MISQSAQTPCLFNGASTGMLLLAVSLIVLTTSCDQDESSAGEHHAPPATNSEFSTTEQQVFYTDMLDAYARGDISTARKLARQHLSPAYDVLRSGKQDLDLRSGLGGTLVVLHDMLILENRLAPSDRLGGDPEFVDWLEYVVINAAKHARRVRGSPKEEAFIRRTLGEVAREWILARQATASRDVLEGLYEEFREELAAQGLRDLDSVLRYRPPDTSSKPSVRVLDHTTATTLFKVIHDYFEGLVGGDVARLKAATGLDDQRVKELLDAYRRDCRDEGIAQIRSVVVPTLSTDNLKLRSNPKQPDLFTVSIQGIRMEMVRADGTVERRTISKNLTLREEVSGRWTIVPPK
ncbi:hypothetical protein D6833_02305 [Candidatus Parcubacteria bacterium]|nr:MAG: hypothetical protein D6833_02305 [Candidatus Parcubacteria bacterium]